MHLSDGRGSFSRASCCGARRGPSRTLRRTLGPRPGSAARTLGVQFRASWPLFHGMALCFAERRRVMETPQFEIFLKLFFALLLLYISCLSRRPSSSQALYFVAATVHQQSHIKVSPFVTAADGVSVYLCVRVPCFPSIYNRRKRTNA